MIAPIILAQNIAKGYRNGGSVTPVLRGVDLAIGRGEFVFLLGPSGSGKSTLLSILGCVLALDCGELEIDGTQISRLGSLELANFRRDHLGFVFQKHHLFKGLSAVENVRVPLDLKGIPREAASREARELLAAVGLGEKLGSQVGQLSMGQRQRIAIARAMAGHPRVILADEPTASLDAHAGRTAIELLRQLATERGTTVVVVTHDPRILGYADRIFELEDGLLKTSAAPPAEGAFSLGPRPALEPPGGRPT